MRSIIFAVIFFCAGCFSISYAAPAFEQQPPDIVVVKPKPFDGVLVNPGIGFTTFQRFNGDSLNSGTKWTEGFPIVYQPFHGSLQTPDFPMTSIAYFRIYWRFVEPEEGVYNWAMLDKALQTAHQRHQTLMLRIAPYGS
ncbi:MAG: beta-galactosidase, partial [Acidobacteriaceae bacterium]